MDIKTVNELRDFLMNEAENADMGQIWPTTEGKFYINTKTACFKIVITDCEDEK